MRHAAHQRCRKVLCTPRRRHAHNSNCSHKIFIRRHASTAPNRPRRLHAALACSLRACFSECSRCERHDKLDHTPHTWWCADTQRSALIFNFKNLLMRHACTVRDRPRRTHAIRERLLSASTSARTATAARQAGENIAAPLHTRTPTHTIQIAVTKYS